MSENAAEELLVKMLLQYPHRLTQEDRQHLAKLKQEIMNTPLLTLEEALNRQREDDKPIEVSRDAFEAGLDYIFGFTGTTLPETFQRTHLSELDETRKIVTASLSLAYNSVVRAARLSVGDTEEEQEENNGEDENTEYADAILVSLHNLATAEDIVKEMISDLGASFVLASLGYYKQGLSTLRNVLESAVLLSYTLAAGEVADWVSGGYGIDKFTQMVKRLAEQGIISKQIEGQILTLYWDYLCTATHSHKARMNAVRSDKHGFDIVRLHEFLGVLSWCGECFIPLLQPLSRNVPQVQFNGQEMDATTAWAEVERRLLASSVGRRARLAKQDIPPHRLAARPPPLTRRASGRCERSKAAAAGRERAGGAPGGSRWHGAGSKRGGAPARKTAGAARWGVRLAWGKKGV